MTDTGISFDLADLADRVAASVNPQRYLRLQRALATFGGREDGGVERQALTEVETRARQWLMAQVKGHRYRWLYDDAGNLFLRRDGREGQLAPVMTGSHMDTQPVGGWLDGAYGVIAGLEVMLALDDAGLDTRFPLELAIWNNEEGSRFGPGAMGSSAFADPSRLPAFMSSVDADGVLFSDALQRMFDAVQTAGHVPLGRPVSAYIEAHIEQGPVLEAAGSTLGVVTGIQGVRWFEVLVTGSSAHAGTTPLDVRQDAVLAAATLLRRIADAALALGDDRLRVTSGRFEVKSPSINTVADRVLFTIDLRHPEEAVLDAFEAQIRSIVGSGAAPCAGEVSCIMRKPPTPFHPHVVALVEQASNRSGELYQRIGSGAFHDAMYLADRCPTGMLFVPSIKGVSHNVAEDTKEEHLVAGVRVLAATLYSLAR
jgi:amidase, hydantoinase/carbamoylase family